MTTTESKPASPPLFGGWTPSVWLKALAGLEQRATPSPDDIWLMSRLSMWATLAQLQLRSDDWRVDYAQAAAYAACRRLDDARAAVERFMGNAEAAEHQDRLIALLSSYLPQEALSLLLRNPQSNPPLLASLHLRMGDAPRAREVLESLPQDAERTWPELFLLRTNVCGGSPAEQMSRLNGFLQGYGLAPVSLRDPQQAPSPTNVVVRQPVEAVHGPLVSVLMTTFRVGDRLSAAMESILSQSWRNLELIVVDDASGDDTSARVQEWAGRDPRIKAVQLPANVGTYAAKLIGLKYATGDFITCHDADDWSHPEKIARQMRFLLDDANAVAVDSYWLRMQDDGRFYTRWLFRLIEWNASSFLFRRNPVLERAGAWLPLRYGADSEFSARLHVVFGDDAVKKFHCPLSLSSHRPDSLMNTGRTFPASTGETVKNIALWEAWLYWHIRTLADGVLPFVSPDIAASVNSPPFEVDDEFHVNAADVDLCLEALEH